MRLPSSHTPLAELGQDLGTVSGSKKLDGLTLVFKRSTAQQADLDALLTALQDPHSPRYHQWLTPATFAARYGMAPADLAAAEGWLGSRGFTVDSVPASHDRINFSGTAAQVSAAFSTDLHTYRFNNEQHFGPATDLFLPTALVPAVTAVLHLSDFRPRPNVRPGPDYTDTSSGTHHLTPADLTVMYDETGLSPKITPGTGQSVAVVGQSYVNLMSGSSVEQFAIQFGQSANDSQVLVPGTGVEAALPGDSAESELDLEYVNGIAPGANTFLVYVGDSTNHDVFDALAYAIQQNIAPVVSISYDACEPLLNASTLDSENALFMQAAAQGQTLIAAAGDSGSTDCASYPSTSLSAAQKQSLAVGFPASSPYVTALGGAQMASGTYASGASSFWSTLNNLGGSLLSYVPEIAWNEGSASAGIAAGGGGASSYFPRPSWQTGLPSMPAGSTRLLPDIALQASIASPGFLICTDDQTFLGYGVQGCYTNLQDSKGRYTVAGGTSFAAPIFAGSVALLNQYEGELGQGAINATLYTLATNPSTYTAAFHDITSGTIACVPGAVNCTASGQSGYSAGPGYDEATGLGSIDMGQLAKAWPTGSATTRLEPTSIAFQYAGSPVGSNTGISAGSSLPISIQVNTLGGTTPSGGVALFLDGVSLNQNAPFSSVNDLEHYAQLTANLTVPATSGSHLLGVLYPGNATQSPTSAVFPFLVGAIQASGGLTLASSNLTLNNNASGSVEISITPNSGYHGEVVWTIYATGTGGTTGSVACYNIDPVRVSGPTTAKLVLGAGTACNAPLPSASVLTRRVQSVRPVQGTATQTPVPGSAPIIGAGFCLIGILTRRRHLGLRTGVSLSMFLLLASIGLTGCGGNSTAGSSASSSGNSGSSGTPTPPAAAPATYSFSVNAHDSVNESIIASTSFTLTVN